MDVIEKILAYLGGVTGAVAVVVAIAQACGAKWLDWWFEKKNKTYQKELDKDVETYKSELKIKSDEIQSQLNAKLALIQIKEQQLGSIRMSAISETYEMMGKFTNEVRRLSCVFKPVEQESDEDIYIKICEYGNEFIRLWDKNKLYFPKDISDVIYNMNKTLNLNIKMYFSCKNSPYQDNREKQYEYAQKISDYLPPVIEQIEKRFREVIGVETKSE